MPDKLFIHAYLTLLHPSHCAYTNQFSLCPWAGILDLHEVSALGCRVSQTPAHNNERTLLVIFVLELVKQTCRVTASGHEVCCCSCVVPWKSVSESCRCWTVLIVWTVRLCGPDNDSFDGVVLISAHLLIMVCGRSFELQWHSQKFSMEGVQSPIPFLPPTPSLFLTFP